MRYLAVVALLLPLPFAGVVDVHAQTISVPLGGPPYECRQEWNFLAGSVQVHFNAGYHVVHASHPTWFEAAGSCGSGVSISLNTWVKNVRLWVTAYPFIAQVRPGGGSVSGLGGRFVTVPGPTTWIDISSTGSAGSRVTVGEISFEFADPPALFSFGATTTGRVLTHKYRSDDAYPSPLQTEDGKIRVEGLVHDLTGSTGIANRKVYFRLIDPPDTADYVVKAGDAKADDNVDGPGKLNGSPTATDTSDSSGKVSVTLEVTGYAAGDNYQIEASLDKDFKCTPAPLCQNQKSIVYTAWKRVYVEAHKMFRVGWFITVPVNPGDKKIIVESVQGFPSPPFAVRLIHAAPLLSATPDFYSETVDVVNVRPVDAGFELILAGWNDMAVPGVMNAYVAEEIVEKTARPYLRDAVGVVTGDRSRDYWLGNGKLTHRPFEDAFVEYVWLTDSVAGVDDDLLPTQSRIPFDGVIPSRPGRIGEADESEREWMTRKWLRSARRTSPGERSSESNHQAMFVAPRHRLRDKQGSFFIGLTTVADGFNDTWLFVREGGMGSAHFRGEANFHELAHQWRVNPVNVNKTGGSDPGGHCDWALGKEQHIHNRPQSLCTMSGNIYGSPEASDGVVGFHYLKQTGKPTDSEFLRIRQRSEPVPQNERTGRNPQ